MLLAYILTFSEVFIKLCEAHILRPWRWRAEERNPYFGWREGGTSSNPHPKELNFVTVINIVKDCFCLGWIVKWHCEEQNLIWIHLILLLAYILTFSEVFIKLCEAHIFKPWRWSAEEQNPHFGWREGDIVNNKLKMQLVMLLAYILTCSEVFIKLCGALGFLEHINGLWKWHFFSKLNANYSWNKCRRMSYFSFHNNDIFTKS